MGITIHYSGRAKGHDALSELLRTAQLFAAEREWQFAIFDDPFGVAEEGDNAAPIQHEGPYRGMMIRPHRKCEPVRLDFNIANEMTPAFTKTQFAPFEVHVEVVKLLRAIEPYMAEFSVTDEAGLWETGDIVEAEGKFAALGRVIGMVADELEDAGYDVDGPGVPELGEDEPE